MPMYFARVPKHIRQVVKSADGLYLPTTFAAWKASLPKRQSGTADKSCQSFFLSLLAIVCSTNPLDTAVPVGWRIFADLRSGLSEIRVDNISDRKARLLSVSGIHPGRLSIAKASQIFQRANIKGDFDVRILSVPPIIPAALWMKRTGRGRDRLVIMESNVHDLLVGSIVTEERFVLALVGPARKLLEFEPEPVGQLQISNTADV
jgi:hypothetical protein